MNTPTEKPVDSSAQSDNPSNEVEQTPQGGAISSSASKQALLQRQRELERALTRSQQAALRVKRRNVSASDIAVEPEEEVWLVTYLDMLTLLLVMLVIMLTFSGKHQKSEMEASKPQDGILPLSSGLLPAQPLPQNKNNQPDPLAGLALDQLGKDIDVVVNEGSVSFRISSEILFSSGQAELSLDGLRVLQKLVPVLNSTRHQVAVAGHTDAIPIHSTRFPSNWELSSARAGSVVRYLQANGVESARLRAVGYADTRPLADNANTEGRASNRRVELVLETPSASK